MIDEERNLFAETNFRNESVQFGIKTDDRRRHMYIIGKSGSGKTNLSEILAINDIRAGKGVCVVDPHGEFADKMLDFIPEERIDDVLFFNPADINFPIAFNPMEHVSSEFRHLVASGIMGVFKKIWVDAWSARMEYILNNTLLALLEYPDATILGVMRMFSDPGYRKKIVSGLQDPVIKGFWVNEYARYSQKFETEAVAAIQNKIGQFVSNPLIRNIIGQPTSAIDVRKIMDEKKILIANLSKGRIGEDNSRLLGAMLITRIYLAAMSRVDIKDESQRNDFYLYVDEFQNFATESFASILSEARKYHLSLILAHQYIEQLDETVRPAVFGNVGTLACFRVGAEDAEFLEKEFMPTFEATDLVNLEKYHIYLRLLIDGVASKPFSASVLPPPPIPDPNFRDLIIENSRNKYALAKSIVDEKISSEWFAVAGAAVGDKTNRRDEQPLGRVLGANSASVIKSSPFANRTSQPAGSGSGSSPLRRGPANNGGNFNRPVSQPMNQRPLPVAKPQAAIRSEASKPANREVSSRNNETRPAPQRILPRIPDNAEVPNEEPIEEITPTQKAAVSDLRQTLAKRLQKKDEK